jgi:hypothetical protein
MDIVITYLLFLFIFLLLLQLPSVNNNSKIEQVGSGCPTPNCEIKEPNMKYSNNTNYTRSCNPQCLPCVRNGLPRINQSARWGTSDSWESNESTGTINSWSTISKDGPGLDDPQLVLYQKRLAEIYPTMSDEQLIRLTYELNNKDCDVSKKQMETIESLEKDIYEYQTACSEAKNSGQVIFRNPLSCFKEQPMDPTLPDNEQPVRFVKPQHLAFMGEKEINDCGEFVSVPNSSKGFMLFEYGKKY